MCLTASGAVCEFRKASWEGKTLVERLELLGWVVEVDSAETASYYARHSQCQCAYCRNFLATMDQWPDAVREALMELGADPQKEGEIMEMGQDPDGLHVYRLACPVRGCVISGALRSWHTGNYEFWFSPDPHEAPVHVDFPPPIMFACLEARLPWVLDQPKGT